MKFHCFILFVLTALCGCNYQQREAQIKKKEAELNQKEQQLLLREQSLAIKEAELQKKESTIDSSANAGVYNDTLRGRWNVQMTCSETTCPGSAVGDSKTEQWNIDYAGTQIIAQVINNNKIVRIYQGIYNGNTVELVEDREGTTDEPATKISIRLQLKGDTSMQGEREIEKENGCRIVYSIQMNKLNS